MIGLCECVAGFLLGLTHICVTNMHLLIHHHLAHWQMDPQNRLVCYCEDPDVRHLSLYGGAQCQSYCPAYVTSLVYKRKGTDVQYTLHSQARLDCYPGLHVQAVGLGGAMNTCRCGHVYQPVKCPQCGTPCNCICCHVTLGVCLCFVRVYSILAKKP